MMIIGCDFHPSWQQVSWLDTETGETGEQKLVHAEGQAQQFYQALSGAALIGMEATGNSQWVVELIEDLGHAIWIGDAAQNRASYVRKQIGRPRVIAPVAVKAMGGVQTRGPVGIADDVESADQQTGQGGETGGGGEPAVETDVEATGGRSA